jgi:hypothetical protein
MSGHWQLALLFCVFGFVPVGFVFGNDCPSSCVKNCGDCSSCATEACGCCFAGCCDPLWTVRADGLLLQRSKPRDAILVTDQATPGGNVLLNANELDPGTSGGWDLSLIRHGVLGTTWDVEGLYYSVDNWLATRGTQHSAAGAWVQFVTPIGNGSYASDVSASYRSSLHNIELNARRQFGPGDLLIGCRYIELRENGLTITQTILSATPNTARYDIYAANRLTGVQVGYEGHILSRGRLGLDGFVKAGVFNNEAGNSVLITQTVGSSYSSAAGVNHTAFVGELGLIGIYQLNEYFRLRGGYQLLWIEGAALATDQVAVSNPAIGTAAVDTDGSPFYHGAVIGLECNF